MAKRKRKTPYPDYLRDMVDCPYWDKLSDEEKQWLWDFDQHEQTGYMKKRGEDYVPTGEKPADSAYSKKDLNATWVANKAKREDALRVIRRAHVSEAAREKLLDPGTVQVTIKENDKNGRIKRKNKLSNPAPFIREDASWYLTEDDLVQKIDYDRACELSELIEKFAKCNKGVK